MPYWGALTLFPAEYKEDSGGYMLGKARRLSAHTDYRTRSIECAPPRLLPHIWSPCSVGFQRLDGRYANTW